MVLRAGNQGAIIITSLLFLTVSAAAAHAHASLAHASPSVGSTVRVAPQEVILTFTERLEGDFLESDRDGHERH